jgi:hypothetical protein
MAYKLQIVDKKSSINFHARFENLANKADKTEITAKSVDGTTVKERSMFNGNVLLPGSTQRKWVDEQGKEYSKSELTFWAGDEQVEENSMTKVFDVQGYAPEGDYTDKYVIGTYYELFPDDNGMKKDIDRKRAVDTNLFSMRNLWEKLRKEKIVARAEFIPSSRGFIASDGYIRAIEIEGKWGLEVGVFKESKVFQHLNEPTAGEEKMEPVMIGKTKRLKNV